MKFWTQPAELPGLVALSLQKTIKLYPAIGWVRANTAVSNEMLVDLNGLRKENAELRTKVGDLEAKLVPSDAEKTGLDDYFDIHIYWTDELGGKITRSNDLVHETWGKLFFYLAPRLEDGLAEYRVKEILGTLLHLLCRYIRRATVSVDDDDFHTARIQLVAMGLVRITTAAAARIWYLTDKGEATMVRLRTAKPLKTETSS